MLCYVTLRYVMLCYVMLCYVTPHTCLPVHMWEIIYFIHHHLPDVIFETATVLE